VAKLGDIPNIPKRKKRKSGSKSKDKKGEDMEEGE